MYIYVYRSCVSRIPLWCVSIFFSFFPNSESLYPMSTNCVRYWPTREKGRESIIKYPTTTLPPFNFVASRAPNTPLYTRLFCLYIYTFLGAGRQKEQKSKKKERAVKVSNSPFPPFHRRAPRTNTRKTGTKLGGKSIPRVGVSE